MVKPFLGIMRFSAGMLKMVVATFLLPSDLARLGISEDLSGDL